MNMESNKFTPAKIAGGNITFSIPLYQRLFSWKGENVKKLLYDMKEQFLKDEDKPYYLGMLTCVKQGEKELLIDGQQRMTVMLLMAIVFKKVHDEWKNFLLDGNRIDFIARPEDKEYIKSKIEEANTQKVQYENLNMKEALRTIESFLENEFKDDNERKTFVKYVYEHLTFFISSLPKNYKSDANLLNKYFEAMNSQGRNLEQHEILKVNLLKGMEKQGMLTQIWNLVSQMEKPIITYEEPSNDGNYRNPYIDNISILRTNIEKAEDVLKNCNKSSAELANQKYMIGAIEPEKRDKFDNKTREEGTDSIISFEDFLLMVLYITMGEYQTNYSDYQSDKLLEKFKDLQKSDEATLCVRKTFFYNLLYYRLLLDYYVIRREFISGEGRYTLLINECDNNGNQKNSHSTRLLQYQSMLYVSTPFYRWLKPYLEELAKGEMKDPEQMLKWLKQNDNERHSNEIDSIDSKEVMQSWTYPNIERYWFWRLDYYLWEDRENWCKGMNEKYRDAVSKYVFRENRSIEHFHPQDESHNTSWNRDVVDSFGNLAMISPSFNSQQSNDNLKIKFDRIYEQLEAKSLQSLKLLRMCLKANFDHSQWTEENAEEHGNEMIAYLKIAFPQKTNNNDVNA